VDLGVVDALDGMRRPDSGHSQDSALTAQAYPGEAATLSRVNRRYFVTTYSASSRCKSLAGTASARQLLVLDGVASTHRAVRVLLAGE
jgi:hypothetical protein